MGLRSNFYFIWHHLLNYSLMIYCIKTYKSISPLFFQSWWLETCCSWHNCHTPSLIVFLLEIDFCIVSVIDLLCHLCLIQFLQKGSSQECCPIYWCMHETTYFVYSYRYIGLTPNNTFYLQCCCLDSRVLISALFISSPSVCQNSCMEGVFSTSCTIDKEVFSSQMW